MSQFETLCSSFEVLHSRSEVPGIGTLASGFGGLVLQEPSARYKNPPSASGSQLLTGK